eukprot:TRINITY_DN12238_c0_g2_i1.p5 TRINITY_DN12238_c0_g2~~TRINITY_DN12238_c0_g2_i1.p5  ORF type:complete len:120 (+),score=1.85 TRINITY_DN12238_c0_g2_i1:984-1343(+)
MVRPLFANGVSPLCSTKKALTVNNTRHIHSCIQFVSQLAHCARYQSVSTLSGMNQWPRKPSLLARTAAQAHFQELPKKNAAEDIPKLLLLLTGILSPTQEYNNPFSGGISSSRVGVTSA